MCWLRRESFKKTGHDGSKFLIGRRDQRPSSFGGSSFGGPPARLKTWNSMDNAFRMLASSLQRKLDPGVRELQITVNNVSAPRVHSLKAPTRNPLHGQSCAMEGAIAFTSQRFLKPTCGCRARPHKDLEIASLLHSRGLSFGVQRA